MLASNVYIDTTNRQIPNTGFTVNKFLLDNAPYLKDIIPAPEISGNSKSTNPYGKNVMMLFANS